MRLKCRIPNFKLVTLYHIKTKIQIEITNDQARRALAILSQGKYSEVADVISAIVLGLKNKVKGKDDED